MPPSHTAASNLLNNMFTMVQTILTDMITNDFTVLVLGALLIQLIIFAGIVIVRFLNMSESEKEARGSFKDWRRSRGTFSEPIHRKRYKTSLKEYEDGL